MYGDDDNKGIIYKLNNDIFKKVDEYTNDLRKFLIEISCFEIYNEVVIDLINPTGIDVFNIIFLQLNIRNSNIIGCYISNLTHYIVKNPEDVNKFIEKCKNNQVKINKQKNNKCHTCFTFTINQINKIKQDKEDINIKLSSNINLIDLGSSDVSGGKEMYY